MTTVRERLAELGQNLPPVTNPIATYVPAVRSGHLVYVSGQIAVEPDGTLAEIGKVGEPGTPDALVSPERAKELAGRCALAALAAADALVGLEQLVRVVKVVGYVASAPGFTGQPAVLNGASDLFVDLFGDAGRHARSAVGVAELPKGAPVEVEVIFEVS
jgi:enamine deaminase RidA (YjgF/YER057c/UK114 family)